MIDERVLNSIISTFNDPSFSVFIKDISQNNECNKDEIIVSLEQVTPNLYKLLQTKEYVIDQLINLLKTESNYDSNYKKIGGKRYYCCTAI